MDVFALEAKKDRGRRSDEERVARLLESYRRDCAPQAIEQLFEMHNRLLKSIVHRHAKSSGEPYEDLLQVGYVGLLKAVQGYEAESGARFGSYAYAMIDGELRHHHRDSRLMKQPRWARSLYSHISQATARLTEKLGRPPLVEEIAEEANVTLEGVQEIMRLFHETDVSSLEEGVDLSAIRSQRYETFSLPIEDRIALEQALDSLSELQRRVVYLFFYKDLTQTEIGKRLGLSQRKVSRTIASATGAMRDLLRIHR
jgi:RNA polymerase sigma-B factor